MRIRVPHEWIQDLLYAALGHSAYQWDSDLWTQWPHLPYPVSQQIVHPDAMEVTL